MLLVVTYVTNGTITDKGGALKITHTGDPLVLAPLMFLINYIAGLELKIIYL